MAVHLDPRSANPFDGNARAALVSVRRNSAQIRHLLLDAHPAVPPRLAQGAWPSPYGSRSPLTQTYDPGVTRRYLGAVPDDEWQALLTEHLARADAFRVHVPDGDGPLSYGRAEFMALPGIEVRPWTGMRDAIEIAGPLSAAARDLFRRMEPSIASFDPEHKLWDYELVQNGTVVLSIGDYHDLQVESS
jgi:hypothetical protein